MRGKGVLWIVSSLVVALIGIALVAVVWSTPSTSDPRKFLVAAGVALAVISLAAEGIQRAVRR